PRPPSCPRRCRVRAGPRGAGGRAGGRRWSSCGNGRRSTSPVGRRPGPPARGGAPSVRLPDRTLSTRVGDGTVKAPDRGGAAVRERETEPRPDAVPRTVRVRAEPPRLLLSATVLSPAAVGAVQRTAGNRATTAL